MSEVVQATKTYFHVTATPFGDGSVMLPGGYGGLLSQYRCDNTLSGWRLVAELIYERIRAAEFPDKPSRWSDCFAFLKLEDARKGMTALGIASRIYEVEPLDPTMPTHVGPFAAVGVQYPNNVPFIADRENVARVYWSSGNGGIDEFVTASAIRILRKID